MISNVAKEEERAQRMSQASERDRRMEKVDFGVAIVQKETSGRDFLARFRATREEPWVPRPGLPGWIM